MAIFGSLQYMDTTLNFTEVTTSYSNDVLNCITVTTVALGTGKQDRNGKREQETEICGSRRDRKNGAKVANLNCL